MVLKSDILPLWSDYSPRIITASEDKLYDSIKLYLNTCNIKIRAF